LFLSGDEKVTLRNLLDGSLDLSAVRLVVLSACQTGLIDVQKVPEEFIGLPAGFLQAGVPGVVGSLWPVNDLSTALLMIRFYEYHLRGDIRTGKGPMPPAWALRKAQLWLRDVTNEELAILFDSYRKSNTSPHLADIAEEQFKKYAPREPNERPFAHPYYWAGFAFYGI
jgi:CHAT domain-containing protein